LYDKREKKGKTTFFVGSVFENSFIFMTEYDKIK